MPIKNDLGSKRYDKTPRIEPKKVSTQTSAVVDGADQAKGTSDALPLERPEVDGGTATAAARRALGFASTPKKPRGAGARSAVHGLSFFDGVKRKLRRGTMSALLGLSVLGSLAPSAPSLAKTTMDHAVAASVLDLRTRRGWSSHALPDAQKILDRWREEMSQDPGFTVDTARAKELVTAALLPAAPQPGDDLAAFAKDKLGDDTKVLIVGLLDGSSFTLDDDARALLAAVVGRTGGGGVSSDGKLTMLGDQSGAADGQGRLSLKGVPGAEVEYINMSTIPNKRLHTDEFLSLGKVGSDGTFTGDAEMRAGDIIRVRLKLPDGTATASLDVRAAGLGPDTRPAEAALFRVGLVDNKDGTISLGNINSSRPISEPGAVMRFVNQRTNEATDITLTDVGNPPDGARIPGKTGDTFSIRITDGVNDKDLQNEISTLTVREAGQPAFNSFDLKDPTLHHEEMTADGKPKFSMERFMGPLFDADGADYKDVTQGNLGDCYFPASIATIAFHKPGTFEKIIQQKREVDQTTGEEKVWYEVHFQKYDWQTSKFKDEVVKVDGDLYVRSWGGPLYGSDDGVRTPKDMELWFSILEKAYAEWKGDSYEAIGNGGQMSQVFEDILGLKTSSMGIYDKDRVWSQIKDSVDKHRPIGAGTHGDDQEALYANTGVYADHAYSIIGYKTDDKGVKYVHLRNPWGESEPYPYDDGKNDGIFYLKLDTFMKLYQTMYFVTQDAP